MKKLKQRMNLRDYRAILKELRKEIKDLGFDLKMRRIPFSWNRYGQGPNFQEIYGSFYAPKKIITIYYSEKVSRVSRVFVLLHETRHLQQYTSNQYNEYYTSTYKKIGELIKTNTLPNLLSGIRAEHNCNKYASNKLKEYGYLHPKNLLQYHKDSVYGWEMHARFIGAFGFKRYCECKNSLPTWFSFYDRGE